MAVSVTDLLRRVRRLELALLERTKGQPSREELLAALEAPPELPCSQPERSS